MENHRKTRITEKTGGNFKKNDDEKFQKRTIPKTVKTNKGTNRKRGNVTWNDKGGRPNDPKKTGTNGTKLREAETQNALPKQIQLDKEKVGRKAEKHSTKRNRRDRYGRRRIRRKVRDENTTVRRRNNRRRRERSAKEK